MTDKDDLQETYLEGYSQGRGVEELSDIAIRTATERFERWHAKNKGENND